MNNFSSSTNPIFILLAYIQRPEGVESQTVVGS